MISMKFLGINFDRNCAYFLHFYYVYYVCYRKQNNFDWNVFSRVPKYPIIYL